MSGKVFNCDLCNYMTTGKTLLEAHKKECHKPSERRWR